MDFPDIQFTCDSVRHDSQDITPDRIRFYDHMLGLFKLYARDFVKSQGLDVYDERMKKVSLPDREDPMGMRERWIYTAKTKKIDKTTRL